MSICQMMSAATREVGSLNVFIHVILVRKDSFPKVNFHMRPKANSEVSFPPDGRNMNLTYFTEIFNAMH